MRISDWSSDVCSSDLLVALAPHMAQAQTPPTAMQTAQLQPPPDYQIGPGDVLAITVYRAPDLQTTARVSGKGTIVKIGSASCRERVCQYVYISVVAVALTKKNT